MNSVAYTNVQQRGSKEEEKDKRRISAMMKKERARSATARSPMLGRGIGG